MQLGGLFSAGYKTHSFVSNWRTQLCALWAPLQAKVDALGAAVELFEHFSVLPTLLPNVTHISKCLIIARNKTTQMFNKLTTT